MEFVYQDNLVCKALNEIKKLIKGTMWENNVYLVGGGVRDFIMGQPIKDIDLCVSIPNGGIAFAEWITKETDCYKAFSNPCIFPNYGTAKFNIKSISSISHICIEVVQTRKEQYKNSNSRNPEVVFGTLTEDAHRRDLTINSLYVNLSNDTIIDPTKKGLDDIHNQIIRTTSSPDVIFNDDPLRMLRCIRFATKYGWGIEKNTWFGIINNAHRISIISDERIRDEISKILLCKKPSIGIRYLLNSGLLSIIMPELYRLNQLDQNKMHFGNVFEHTMAVIDKLPENLNYRLAGLLHDIGKSVSYTKDVKNEIHFYGHEYKGIKIAEEILKRLKFPNADISSILSGVEYHMYFKYIGDKSPSKRILRHFLSKINEQNLDLILSVIDADNKSHADGYCLPNQINLIKNEIKDIYEIDKFNIKLPIDGNDIKEHFKIEQGPDIGRLLSIIKEKYIDNPNLTKEDCIKILQEKLLY